jgi:hypothetical protein
MRAAERLALPTALSPVFWGLSEATVVAHGLRLLYAEIG